MNAPHHAHHPSLDDQIQEIQARLSLRHRNVEVRTERVAYKLKKNITSPLALAGAFAGGFIIDRVLRLLPKRAPRALPSGAQAKPGFIARIMEVFVLGRSLLTAWPAAAFRRFISLGNAWPRTVPGAQARPEYQSTHTIYP